jgi:hypothetical protein
MKLKVYLIRSDKVRPYVSFPHSLGNVDLILTSSPPSCWSVLIKPPQIYPENSTMLKRKKQWLTLPFEPTFTKIKHSIGYITLTEKDIAFLNEKIFLILKKH